MQGQQQKGLVEHGMAPEQLNGERHLWVLAFPIGNVRGKMDRSGWKNQSAMRQQFWDLWGECGQNSVQHLGKKSYFTIFEFDSQRDMGPPESGWKECSGVVISQRITALGIPAVLQTLKSNSARECFSQCLLGSVGALRFS